MRSAYLNLYITLQTLLRQEEGQDLVEYALVIGLVVLAAVAGLRTLAGPINALIGRATTALNAV
jgi:pilus assembly protein Flp/PilA